MMTRIKQAVRRLLRPYYKLIRSRDQGMYQEMKFWDLWFRTKGHKWPEDYARRMDPYLPLEPEVRHFLDSLPQSSVRILDIGAGPLTSLGKTHPTKTVSIVATDLLAPQYDELMAKYGVNPPVRTVYAAAEALTQAFGETAFDLVHARNSLDHTSDPVAAIEQTIRVLKPGCFAILRHARNEAEHENYKGFHQWNFDERNADFHVWSKANDVNVSQQFSQLAEVTCFCTGGFVAVDIRKRHQGLPGPRYVPPANVKVETGG